MIKELKYKEAILIDRIIVTEGHSPLEIVSNDFNRYFVKNTRGKKPSFPIINEFVCHYLLNLWNIATPEIAAVKIGPDLKPQEYGEYHKGFYYEQHTFGSLKMNNVIEMSEFSKISSKYDYNKINKTEDLLKIALFDIWVENTDRKPTNPNILFESVENRINIIAIDHAFAFDHQSYDNLYVEGVTLSYNESILEHKYVKYISKELLKQKGFLDELKDYYYFCINKSHKYYDEITSNIPDSLGFSLKLQNSLKQFLFNENRNKEVFNYFCSSL